MRWLQLGLVLGIGCVTGCEGLFNPTTKVTLAISHHGTRTEAGKLPDLGEPNAARVFVNDLGWRITLSDAVIVMTAAQIEACTGETFDFTLPYGPLPEYQLARDRDLVHFATVDLPEGSYCTLRVEYGRYQAAEAAKAFDTPFKHYGTAPIEGVTMYLMGTAERDDGSDDTVKGFGFETSNTMIVELDLRTVEDGHAFTITTEEPSGKVLTVAKTYDAFFAGIDFAAVDEAKVEASLLEVLKDETYVRAGPEVY